LGFEFGVGQDPRSSAAATRIAMANSAVDGKWFREEDPMWKGYSVSLQIEEILYKQSSQYQDILVFKR
jgi:hypothetical protein